MELKVFTLPTCPNCPEAKRIAQEVGAKFEVKCVEIDLSTSEGMVEGLIYQIMSTPSIALDDEVLVRGGVLSKEELENEIKKRLSK